MKRHILLFILLIACFLQLGGALLYMTALGQTAVAPWIFGLIKFLMMSIPFLALATGWKAGRFFKGASWKDVILGIGIGILFFVLMIGIFYFFPTALSKAFADAEPRAQAFGIATPGVFLIASLLFSLMHSLFEEFYWRWFVFGAMQLYTHRSLAIVFSGLTFSLHHIIVLLAFTTPVLAVFFGLMVGAVGCLWTLLYIRRGNIVSSWISHIFADLAIAMIGYLVLFGVN